MQKKILFGCLISFALSNLQGEAPEPVVWSSPSESSAGSMPIGNGDIALNVWAEKDGTIRTYLAKTDAWDGAGRLLRLGGLNITFSPNPFADEEFQQTLDASEGVITFKGTDGFQARVWVDANAPVVRFEASSPEGIDVTVEPKLWRRERREIPPVELMGYSWYMGGAESALGIYAAPEPVVSHPDIIADLPGDRIGWYQRNETSFWKFGFEHQQMGGPPSGETDPLLHRTFGVLMESEQLRKSGLESLKTVQPVRNLRLDLVALTQITPSASDWLNQITALLEDVRANELTTAWAAHVKWWNEFWERSYVNVTRAPAPVVTLTTNPLLFGRDQSGQSGYRGTLGRVRIFSRALDADAVKNLKSTVPEGLAADWDFTEFSGDAVQDSVGGLLAEPEGSPVAGQVAGRSGATLDGSSAFRVAPHPRLDLSFEGTIEVLVSGGPQGEMGGRLVDKITPGSQAGYLVDTFPADSLRLITASGALNAPAALPAESWHRIVATFGPTGRAIYLDGELIADETDHRDPLSLARSLNEAYGLQRFLSACAGRGAFPIRFNGSLFWGERPAVIGGEPIDPDWRLWAADYWWQNTRLPYYPMLASGDFEMMRPLFEMYYNRLPTELARTKAWFGCEGAFLGETASFWGMMSNGDYGYERPPELEVGELKNGVMRYYWQPGLELTFMMLDFYDYTGDEKFLRERITPMAEAYLRYYASRFQRDETGKLRITPAQSLETWSDTVNPTPDVAGITEITRRLLALPAGAIPDSLIDLATDLAAAVPPLPRREVDGKEVIGFAEEVLSPRTNVENPELYPVYPYRIFGLGKPELEMARATYAERLTKDFFGWHQSGMQAACLGFGNECATILASNLTNKNPNFRFPIMWGPNYDWVPDQDHGANIVNTLQLMLLQADGDRILLAPAWPTGWEADFKLHAPQQTTVEASIRDGKLIVHQVTPPEREKDIVDLLESAAIPQ